MLFLQGERPNFTYKTARKAMFMRAIIAGVLNRKREVQIFCNLMATNIRRLESANNLQAYEIRGSQGGEC
jgi:hypothetical protein